MAENKKSFLLYTDIFHTVSKLPDEKAGQLFKHILAYVNDKNPETDDLIIQISFEPIKQALKRDLRKYEDKRQTNRENALARWNKPDDATACDRINTDANHAVSDSVIDNVSDSDSVIDNEEESKKPKKEKFAEFVFLLPEEYQKLIIAHGTKNTDILITILNNYKGSNGKKYKSDYLAILNWVIDRAKNDGKYICKEKLSV
jgi:hypothetical protein